LRRPYRRPFALIRNVVFNDFQHAVCLNQASLPLTRIYQFSAGSLNLSYLSSQRTRRNPNGDDLAVKRRVLVNTMGCDGVLP
jgi:hypothetical protein